MSLIIDRTCQWAENRVFVRVPIACLRKEKVLSSYNLAGLSLVKNRKKGKILDSHVS